MKQNYEKFHLTLTQRAKWEAWMYKIECVG